MSIDLFLGGSKENPREVFKINETLVLDKNKFDIGDRIRAGGNAVIHSALDSDTGDEFAIKFQLKLKDISLRRFQMEQEICRQVSHQHLIRYITHGTCRAEKRPGGQNVNIPFLVMEKGQLTLHELLKNETRLEFEQYAGQIRGLASALCELHKVVIHRDIKPSNILLIGDRWVLSDFGLCAFLEKDNDLQLTRVGERIGPLYWMSPEECTRAIGFESDIAEQSDVFQLASVFWVIVNQRHPSGVLTKDDWDGPEQLFSPLYIALQHDRERRFNTGCEFFHALENALEQI